jgi:hypothetical protein
LTNGTAQFKTETDDKTMILGVLNEVERAVELAVEPKGLEVETSEEGNDQT